MICIDIRPDDEAIVLRHVSRSPDSYSQRHVAPQLAKELQDALRAQFPGSEWTSHQLPYRAREIYAHEHPEVDYLGAWVSPRNTMGFVIPPDPEVPVIERAADVMLFIRQRHPRIEFVTGTRRLSGMARAA